MKRQVLRKLILLVSFAVFPITVVYLSPAPPIMSLRQGVVNLSVLVLAAVFFSGFFLRRAFCGWLCPGAGCQLVSKALNDKPLERKKVNWIRIGIVCVWAAVVLATAIRGGLTRVDLLDPGPGRFAASHVRYYLPYIPVTVFMVLFVLLFGRRGFCHRGCWINPIVSAATFVGRWVRLPSLHVEVRDGPACVSCKKCSRNCPMSIDVMTIVQESGVLPNGCVQCGTCIDSCPEGVLSYRFSSETYRRHSETAA
jgi:polyferredoxin